MTRQTNGGQNINSTDVRRCWHWTVFSGIWPIKILWTFQTAWTV